MTQFQNKLDEISKLQTRYDEIEEWLIDNPYMHPEWEVHMKERNDLELQIEDLNEAIKYTVN